MYFQAGGMGLRSRFRRIFDGDFTKFPWSLTAESLQHAVEVYSSYSPEIYWRFHVISMVFDGIKLVKCSDYYKISFCFFVV